MPRSAQPINPSSVEEVVAALRRMILVGEFVGGQKLLQEDLAQRLGASRMPIRTALHILATEGLVTYRPNRGYAVYEMTYDDFRQVRRMRAALETQALSSLIWPNAGQLDHLRQLNELHYSMGKAGDYDESAMVHRQFHDSILGLSDLSLVVHQYLRVQTLSDLFRFRYIDDESSVDESLQDHNRMIRALKEHDLESLVHIRRAHSREFEAQVRRARTGHGAAVANSSSATNSR